YSAESIRRQLLSSTKKVSSGAIHHDIDLAKVFDRLCDCLFNFLRLTHVGNNRERLATVIVDRVCSRLQVIDLTTRQCHARSRFSKCARYSTCNTCSTTRHERHASIQNSIVE